MRKYTREIPGVDILIILAPNIPVNGGRGILASTPKLRRTGKENSKVK